ncbi:MAG TPA: multifunctional CCA tRNA nucleotidyl transferase/2'3'-cyclic phosphodiesterase/2'nucleotidase/phosphatase, partial [Usitatibacteraceae bacterium]|nr:multifunctional CCA tRNA nucleotidyl transferase/2'3'-cyclic phosphodiesterase/2'nucleotidase/phosphatase [Usitatibacteraceae bacterium]
RDELLGLPVADRDWVVVGATPAEMAARGFRAVGSDFPVFLHPDTHEEYALARTERKTAPGYKGFVFHASPEVTLEEDLLRRDLTINAIARGEDGVLVDPHGGIEDLRRGILRHVSEAFAEDPVRILRVARFAARFGFAVAPETLQLMRRMVHSGEADHLVPERVWQEVARGLQESRPARMIEVLRECGALERVLPEVESLATGDGATLLAARLEASVPFALCVRFACLTVGLAPEAARALCERINAPGECRDLAGVAARERAAVEGAGTLRADALLALLERTDAFRRPERLERLMEVCACDLRARGLARQVPRERIHAARVAALEVDAASIARDHPQSVAAAIHAARAARIAEALASA